MKEGPQVRYGDVVGHQEELLYQTVRSGDGIDPPEMVECLPEKKGINRIIVGLK